MQQCKATTRAGSRCNAFAIQGATVCRMHGGSAPQVRQKALERIQSLVHPSLDAMQQALNLGMAQDFEIATPLMALTKAETWGLAKGLGGEALVAITVEETHTCYTGERGTLHAWGYGCGSCPACELRRRGYERWDAEGRFEVAP